LWFMVRCWSVAAPTGDLPMERCRIHVLYSGRVQGVGFRATVKNVAAGYEVVGTIRNLPDGRVELLAEGARQELEEFRVAVENSGLGRLVRGQQVSWSPAEGGFKGFEIVR
jgi:acylphosphatase